MTKSVAALAGTGRAGVAGMMSAATNTSDKAMAVSLFFSGDVLLKE
jgi:hypothetical protein